MVAQPMPITTDIYLADNNTPDKKKGRGTLTQKRRHPFIYPTAKR
jgi:hypothetical protein